MPDRVLATKSRRSLQYRLRQTDAETDAGTVCFFEYQQNPKDRHDWGPRGTVYLRDGKFHWGERVFNSADEALTARVLQGP